MTANIYTALAAVMADCDHVAKRDRNEHQRFLFRGIDAVVNAVGPVLRKHGVIVTPEIVTVDYGVVQTSTGKPAQSCRVVVAYTFHAPDGSSIVTTVAGEAWDNGDKATPKAMSVAFRTALLQALALPTDEPDPDAQTYETAAPKAQRASGPKKASQAQLAKVGAMMTELGIVQREDALLYVKDVVGREIGSRNDLTTAECSRLIEALDAELGPQKKAERLPTTPADDPWQKPAPEEVP